MKVSDIVFAAHLVPAILTGKIEAVCYPNGLGESYSKKELFWHYQFNSI